MRKLLTSLVLRRRRRSGSWRHAPIALRRDGYRWYRDYAPLYPQVYYGPPVVYVVPPAYAYYPRPVYGACCGYVVGPAAHLLSARPDTIPRQRYVRPYYVGRRGRCCY